MYCWLMLMGVVQGPGWCQSGYYCGGTLVPVGPGASRDTGGARCLPVPENCGVEGQRCCPSNSVTPLAGEKAFFRPAFCKDGSTCFEPLQHGNVVDYYRAFVRK